MKYSIKCSQCGNMVDSKEPCCPNCGNQTKKKNTSLKVFLIIFAIFFILPIVFVGVGITIISHSFSEVEEFIDDIDKEAIIDEFEKFGTKEETISQLTYKIPNTLTTLSKTSSQYSNYENIYKYIESSGNCTINIISNINTNTINYSDNVAIINDLEMKELLPKVSRVDNVLINDHFWGYVLFENEAESHKYYVTKKNASHYIIKYTKNGTSNVCDEAFSTISESLSF